ncbi:MAG TPA: 4-hydroxy-3-methylbut-2-enyl diphosphate reductase [Bacteroidales bacterium]|nr:4-hydroxy-3-methylbut-2-enyl diphosphate reductase [Bacteroidales bacterium]
MEINIDKKSGFCFGVVKAIGKAEEALSAGNTLYCLGDIVHNQEEVKRLESIGLITIDHEQFKTLKNVPVLIRAHGEPPETYRIAEENGIELIDASCPVVLKLQSRIKTGYENVHNANGQLVIYGKHGHAEVNGLLGQVQSDAIVISNESELEKIDFSKPISLFSQTTKSLQSYYKMGDTIKQRMQEAQQAEEVNFVFTDTICRQVSNRDADLRKFAQAHDVVVFVSGKKSSNGQVLYGVCKEENPNSYIVSNEEEVDVLWFNQVKTVGISGATSTPMWLMEKVKAKINSFV